MGRYCHADRLHDCDWTRDDSQRGLRPSRRETAEHSIQPATTGNPGSGRIASDLKSAWNSFNPDFERVAKLAPAVPVFKKMLDKDARHRPSAGSAAASLRELGDKALA